MVGIITKREVLLVGLLLLIVIVIGCKAEIKKEVDYSQAVPNYTAEILQKFQESEYVRVTVILNDPPLELINHTDPKEKIKQKKAYTEVILNHLLSNLDPNQYELFGILTIGFVIRVNEAAYLQLLNNSYIKEIQPEREVRIS